MPGSSKERQGARIAVVVPCYNDGATLREAVDSALDQEPCELVVVDDGSDDSATLAAFDELEHAGITVIHQENAGLSAARMAGVRATNAPYVFALDADDFITPGSLGLLADALDSAAQACAAWGDELMFGDVEQETPQATHLDSWLVTYLNEWPVAAMLRRAALLEAGGWQLRGGYEDWDLWMAFAERDWGGVHVSAVVTHYRVQAGRMLRDSLTRHDEIYANLQRRHHKLFKERPRRRRSSQAPRRAKLLFPLIDALPSMSSRQKLRLYSLALHPLRTIRGSLLRRRLG